jgi:hypothetical protein
MKVGLHIADFTREGGPTTLRSRLGEVARRAEDAGVDRLSRVSRNSRNPAMQ